MVRYLHLVVGKLRMDRKIMLSEKTQIQKLFWFDGEVYSCITF